MQAIEQIEDSRSPSNGTLHDLREILVIAICAVLSDVDTFEEIMAWTHCKQGWLSRFLTPKNGIPSEDTFLRIFRLIDPKQFEAAFRARTAGILPALDNSTIAIRRQDPARFRQRRRSVLIGESRTRCTG